MITTLAAELIALKSQELIANLDYHTDIDSAYAISSLDPTYVAELKETHPDYFEDGVFVGPPAVSATPKPLIPDQPDIQGSQEESGSEQSGIDTPEENPDQPETGNSQETSAAEQSSADSSQEAPASEQPEDASVAQPASEVPQEESAD